MELGQRIARLLIRGWEWVVIALWVLVLVCLPLTSFPPVVKLTGAIVAPFSMIPLAILVVVWFIPYLLRKGELPSEGKLLMVFALVVLGISAYAFFLDMGYIKGKTLLPQTMRSLLPLMVGLAFYFLMSAWPKDEQRLRRTLQLIQVGGILVLLWSVAQFIIIHYNDFHYPAILKAIRTIVVTQAQAMESSTRLGGFTYEASWFAHQLNMLYLPLWLAATYRRTSVFPKLWKISVENVCLVVGMGAFFLTSPRIGLLAFMLMIVFIFLKFNLAVYRWVMRLLFERWRPVWKQFTWTRIVVGILTVMIFIGLYGGFSSLVFKVASGHDWRLALIANNLSNQEIRGALQLNESSILYLGYRFAFLERTVYWITGWHIFNDYPWLGVGMGNSGFFFEAHMPAVGWSTYEIREVLYLNKYLPNIKSMWFRLLSETGIAGFGLFTLWLVLLFVSTLATQHSRSNTLATMALAGQLALMAFIFEGHSVDSFGMPYLWVIMGLAAAAGRIYRREISTRLMGG